jgi:hypothetical protein
MDDLIICLLGLLCFTFHGFLKGAPCDIQIPSRGWRRGGVEVRDILPSDAGHSGIQQEITFYFQGVTNGFRWLGARLRVSFNPGFQLS